MFLVNSRHPLACAPRLRLPGDGAPFSRSYGGNLPSSFSAVLSSTSVFSTSPPVSVSGTAHLWRLFPGHLGPPTQSVKGRRRVGAVTVHGRGNVDPLAIGYAFRPRLRDRLTLRGSTLRRNPWAFGDGGSRPVERYSCRHSRFPYLHRTSQCGFTGLGNAPLPPDGSADPPDPQLRCVA